MDRPLRLLAAYCQYRDLRLGIAAPAISPSLPQIPEIPQGVKISWVKDVDITIHDNKPRIEYYTWRNDPFMPVEFSAAAYRFGHSMVRPIYRLSRDLHSGGSDGAGRRSIFAEAKTMGLNGFDEFPRDWAIDWDLYFEVGSALNASRVAAEGRSRVQPSTKSIRHWSIHWRNCRSSKVELRGT